MKTTFIFTLLFAALLPLPAQNITDLAVMNDRTADTFIGNGTQLFFFYSYKYNPL